VTSARRVDCRQRARAVRRDIGAGAVFAAGSVVNRGDVAPYAIVARARQAPRQPEMKAVPPMDAEVERFRSAW
jgi:hypothetical protein